MLQRHKRLQSPFPGSVQSGQPDDPSPQAVPEAFLLVAGLPDYDPAPNHTILWAGRMPAGLERAKHLIEHWVPVLSAEPSSGPCHDSYKRV